MYILPQIISRKQIWKSNKLGKFLIRLIKNKGWQTTLGIKNSNISDAAAIKCEHTMKIYVFFHRYIVKILILPDGSLETVQL